MLFYDIITRTSGIGISPEFTLLIVLLYEPVVLDSRWYLKNTSAINLAIFYTTKSIIFNSNGGITKFAVTGLQTDTEQVMKYTLYFISLNLIILVSFDILKNV